VFGGAMVLARDGALAELHQLYPHAQMLGCSTAGEIHGTTVDDETLVATAVRFAHTRVRIATADLDGCSCSAHDVGAQLARELRDNDLSHIFVLSDGLRINGSELVRGLTGELPADVAVTGGLSADAALFRHTFVLSNGAAVEGRVAALGFYGTRLRIGFGSMGGWDPFGPDRVITRSKANILYEMDGRSALDLYKLYLGEHAAELPSSALLFPLSVKTGPDASAVIRSVLGINEEDQSLVFAGDVPEGSQARLMKANFDRLIDGATEAARRTLDVIGPETPQLAILISCVGRRLVLKQRVEEELEAVRDVLGEQTLMTGFYSYGEISPFSRSARCELHNQTMTITTLSEH